MVIFHCYVSSPEGTYKTNMFDQFFIFCSQWCVVQPGSDFDSESTSLRSYRAHKCYAVLHSLVSPATRKRIPLVMLFGLEEKLHSLFFLCSPIDTKITKTLRYDSLSCSPRRVWRNQVSTSAMKCHTPRPTQRLAMVCHIVNLAETGRSVVLAAVSGKTRRATCASPTTRQRSPS